MSDSLNIPAYIEEIEETDDVGHKRYLMMQVFQQLLENLYEKNGKEFGVESAVKDLKEFEGYFYKLSQDFLTSSSTLEKKRKLDKMIEFADLD